MRSQQHILTLIIAFVILSAIGIGTAAYYKLPAGLDCPSCTEDTVFQDSITHGTAITAPVVMLAAFLVFGLLVQRRGWVGLIGSLGIYVISMVFFVASALDSATRDVLDGAVSLNADDLLPAMIYLVCAGLVVSILIVNAKDSLNRFQLRSAASTVKSMPS
ncbi:MAG: hypothetical protein KJ064_02450 [Anaerolineae bacterium]|nr:hypothetical protein [Anaerolineae bacterium]